MYTIQLSRLWQQPLALIKQLPKNTYHIMDGDKQILVTHTNDITLSAALWDPFKKLAPDYLPSPSDFYSAYEKAPSGARPKLVIQSLFWKVSEFMGLETPEDRYEYGTWQAIMQSLATVWSEIVLDSTEYVSGVDVTHYQELVTHPTMLKLHERVIQPGLSSVDIREITTAFNDFLKNEAPVDNPIIQQFRAGVINASQLRKVLLLAGKRRQLTRAPIHEAVQAGFYRGLPTISDYAKESRMAAASADSIAGPLRAAGASIRRAQIHTSPVTGLVYGDCGGKRHSSWLVKGPEFKDGVKVSDGDLELIDGMYYYDNDGVERMLTPKDKHLYGQIINLRSPLTCSHSDPTMICDKCFGDLYHNINPYVNIGVIASMHINHSVFQRLLGGKHDTADADTNRIRPDGTVTPFFRVSKTGLGLDYLGVGSVKQVLMVFHKDQVLTTANLMHSATFSSLEPMRSAKIFEAELIIIDKRDNVTRHTLNLGDNGRKAYFSAKALELIEAHGLVPAQNRHYALDITKFPVGKSLLEYADRTLEINNLGDAVMALLEGKLKIRSTRHQSGSPLAIATQLFDILQAGGSPVHLSLLLTVVYAMMVESKYSFGLSRFSDDPVLHTATATMDYRSLSGRLALRSQAAAIADPAFYLPGTFIPSPYDVFFRPNETTREAEG